MRKLGNGKVNYDLVSAEGFNQSQPGQKEADMCATQAL